MTTGTVSDNHRVIEKALDSDLRSLGLYVSKFAKKTNGEERVLVKSVTIIQRTGEPFQADEQKMTMAALFEKRRVLEVKLGARDGSMMAEVEPIKTPFNH